MIVCIGLAAVPSCLQQTKRSKPAIGPLSSGPISVAQSADMPNDNSLCLVCHVNFAEDDSIAGHISQRITCAHCHGKSVDHMNDESLMTPPDILYGRTEVEAMCTQCHGGSHKDPQAVEAFINKWAGEKRENGRNVTESSICTDCHGRHTIPRR
jgi:hypothetical protein